VNASNSAWPVTESVMPGQPSAPDPELLTALSRRSGLELGAYETAPRTARGHIARVLEEWSLPEFAYVAALVASELITNSVLETAKVPWAVMPPVRLWLRGGPPGVAILVWDALAAAPAPRTAREGDENGRGLAIVADLSAACGFYPAASPSGGNGPAGKVTWAIVTTP
jgi:hypothetical protein